MEESSHMGAFFFCAMRNVNKGWVWCQRLGKCFGWGRRDWARRGVERLYRRCPESGGRAPGGIRFLCVAGTCSFAEFLRPVLFLNSRGRPGRAVRVLAGGRNRDRSRRHLRFRARRKASCLGEGGLPAPAASSTAFASVAALLPIKPLFSAEALSTVSLCFQLSRMGSM